MSATMEGPGPALRAAREERGIAVREVAEVLNLPMDTVEAIEANDYDALPAAVFAKGYIRAYGKLLELDSDPLVASYPDAPAETPEQKLELRDQIGELVRGYPQYALGGAAALGILVLALLIVLIWPDGDETPTPADTPAVAATAPSSETDTLERLAAETPEQTLPSPNVPAPAPPTDPQRLSPDPAADATADTVADIATAVATQPEPNVSAAPAAGTGSSLRRITTDGDDRLSFDFSQECWVEVKSSAGTNLYSNLGRAGQTLDLVGQAPFRILLGYAPGVAMSFNGEPVALTPHTRNNVANLVLGQ